MKAPLYKGIPFEAELRIFAPDPANTDAVFTVSDRLAARPELVAPMLAKAAADPGFMALYEEGFHPKHPKVADLAALPEGTLGKVYAKHLMDNGLDPDFYPDREPTDLLSYLILRLRQTHDIWHALTGWGIMPVDELALQAFGLAQVGSPNAAFLIGHGLLRTAESDTAQLPELMAALADGYTRGDRAAFLPGVAWEKLWSVPVAELREKYGIVVH